MKKYVVCILFFSLVSAMEYEGPCESEKAPVTRPRSWSDPLVYYYSLTLFDIDPVTFKRIDGDRIDEAPTPPPSPVFQLKSRKQSCTIQ